MKYYFPVLTGLIVIIGLFVFFAFPTPPLTVNVPHTQLAQVVSASNLAAFYDFEEGSGTTIADSSGAGRNGTLSGGTTWVAGKVGSKAISFDGSTGAMQAALPTTASTNITLAAWIYPTSGSLQNGNIVYIGSPQNGYGLSLSNGVCGAGSGLAVLMEQRTCNAVSSNPNIPTNTWTHVALTRDTTTWQLYVNGSVVGNGTLDPNAPTGNLRSGTQVFTSGTGNKFQGAIDDLRVYTRTLSTSEIQILAGSGSTGGGTIPTPPPSTPPPTNPTVTVSTSGTGAGTVAGGGINCGSACSATIAAGQAMTLTATAGSGATFMGWNGPCAGTSAACTFTVNGNVSVGAVFNASSGGSVSTNTYFIRPGGSGDGTSWSNAWAGTGSINWSKIVPGTTICIAGGNYSPFVIATGGTASARIYIKRATASDPSCGQAKSGWNSAYDSQVVIRNMPYAIRFTGNSSYVTIDGVVDNGIKLDLVANDITGAPSYTFGILMDAQGPLVADYDEFKHIEFKGPGGVFTNSPVFREVYPFVAAFGSNGDPNSHSYNILISNCYFHDSAQGIHWDEETSGGTVEYTKFWNINDNGGDTHSNVFYIHAGYDGVRNGVALVGPNDITFRYNDVGNIAAQGVYAACDNICNYITMKNFKIYGNIFHDSPTEGSPAISVDLWRGGALGAWAENFEIHNNVFSNYWQSLRADTGELRSGSIKNNIFHKSTLSFSANGVSHDYNWFSLADSWTPSEPHSVIGKNPSTGALTDPFVNAAGGDYHIKSTVSSMMPKDKGVSLASNFAVDLDGKTRGSDGSWDIGAYEYNGSTAPPPATTYGVSVNKSGTGAGTVSGGSISCGSTCSVTVSSGAVISLSASAVSGSTFAGWTGACSGTSASCTVTANSDISVGAIFNATVSNPTPPPTPPPSVTTYTVNLTKTGNGAGTVSGSTINCGTICSMTVNAGTSVTLSTSAVSGSTFSGWSGACSGSSASCTLTINGNTSITATFNLLPATVPLMSGLSFEAEAGLVEAPFSVGGGVITQSVQTTDPSQSGRARYRFSLPQGGDYVVKMIVNAQTTANDSAYVTIDGEPTEPFNVWDIAVTSGLQERTLSWRGNGAWDNNQFNPKVFTLAAGEHTLFIRGRESNLQIDSIKIVPYAAVVNYTLNVTKTGAGQGTVTGNGINCGTACTISVPSGTNVTLSASAITGSAFTGWSGSCTGSITTCTLAVNGNSTVSAAFKDTTAPTITNIATSNVTGNSATISWTTDKASDTQVEYGLTIAYGLNTALNTTATLTHTASLTGLSAGTKYFYRVRSADASQNLAISPSQSFTTSATPPPVDTTAPVISAVSVSNVTSNTAKISWTTNEPSSSKVNYGIGNLQASVSDSTLSTSHVLNLSNLTKNSQYSYTVTSADAAGNSSNSTVQIFSTTGRTAKPPKVTNVTAAIGSVILNWKNPGYEYQAKSAIYKSISPLGSTPDNATKLTETTQETYRDENVTAGNTYYYGIYAVDDLGVFSDGEFISVTLPNNLPPSNSGGGGGQSSTPPGGSGGGAVSYGVGGIFYNPSAISQKESEGGSSGSTGSVSGSAGSPTQGRTNTTVNMRSAPSLSGQVKVTAVPGTIVTYTGETKVANGYTWTSVRLGNGSTGWMVSTFITPITTTTTSGSSSSSSSSGLQTNDSAITTTKVNMRTSASLSAAIRTKVPEGISIKITGAAVKKDGYSWVPVTFDNGVTGWMADEFLRRTGSSSTPQNSTTNTSTSKADFKTGDRITPASGSSNIRVLPGLKSRIVQTTSSGIFIITGEPVSKDGYTWYPIRLANNGLGWVAGEVMKLSTN